MFSGTHGPLTLTRFIQRDKNLSKERRDEMVILFGGIQFACKIVSNSLKRAGLDEVFGYTGTQNVHGEDVKKLDVIANDAFKAALQSTEQVCAMVSEEETDAIYVPEHLSGKYIITFDPLDGSSNIDANVSVGSIFGIYAKKSSGTTATKQDCLQPGCDQVGAGYALYGSTTILVVSLGSGVNGFTYDYNLGEFVLSHPNLRVKREAAIYSVNEGNSSLWAKPVLDYVHFCKTEGKDKKPYSSRYIGSMVADVHRTLLYGGVFMYPADSKNPNGKLRYSYEVAPLSYLMEKAGGSATTGTKRCLDIVPENIHLRVPVFMGSADAIKDVERFHIGGQAEKNSTE